MVGWIDTDIHDWIDEKVDRVLDEWMDTLFITKMREHTSVIFE